MSRAFVKEPDSDQADEEILERPQSEFPNYMTLPGLNEMKARLDELRRVYNELKLNSEQLSVKNQIKTVESDIRYLEKRVLSAIPVDINSQTGDVIRFGATVDLVDAENQHHTFRIVGEDEADARQNLISWVSPLARELIGKQPGDSVVWKKPAGDQQLEITDFRYVRE